MASVAAGVRFGHRFHAAVEVEAAGLLAQGKFAEALQPLPDIGSHGQECVHVLDETAVLVRAFILGALEGVGAQAAEHRRAQGLEWFMPEMQPVGVLHQEADFPLVVAQSGDAASKLHGAPGVFLKARQFLTGEEIEMPPSDSARQFYKSGPPFLQRYLPFWPAVFVRQ